VGPRSDIFSFGSVLYEMFTGRRAFAGSSQAMLLTAILRDDPPPLRDVRPGVPAGVEPIVRLALEKNPASRYPDAMTMRADLIAARTLLTHPPEARWRKGPVVVPAALLLLVAAGFGIWQMVHARSVRWAREVAVPQLEQLRSAGRHIEALRLVDEIGRRAPREADEIRNTWFPLSIASEPAGADLMIRDYLDVDGPWHRLGRTPIDAARVPFGYYRIRMERPGFVPLEMATAGGGRRTVVLTPEGSGMPGMVAVAGGPFAVGVAATVELADFWIDRLEVSNREYKRFVDAGGYRDRKFWTTPLVDRGRELAFEEAVARFTDSTGVPGPATWEVGSFPEGEEDVPVGGISWFEADAYARFAGKSLPTVYHWYRAAPREELSADILQLSNFDGRGPVKAGERQGLGPWGTLDMAGNVKEWCANPVSGSDLRYILGGGWNEPHYRYMEEDARSPWERRPTYGVRLVKAPDIGGAAAAPIARLTGDPKSVVPVSDAVFAGLRSHYTYDRTPLNSRIERTDEGREHWRVETVSFDAAYGGERVRAFVFLPRSTKPPYQTVVLFPSRYAVNAGSSQHLDYERFEFIVRSGRALIYPIYQGTYERRKEEPDGPSARRDLHVQWAKDFFRAVDYLETRDDIDMNRLAYYSLSMGAYFGPIPVALEPRITTAVFASGGLRFNTPPEIQPANFMPHVKVPVLMINGRDDFQAPADAQNRFLELLGTPPEHKRLVQLDGGHVPMNPRDTIRHALEWFDRYLGPIDR